MSLHTTSSQLTKPGPMRPSSSAHQSLGAGSTSSGVERSEAVVRGERLREEPAAIEAVVGGSELRAEGTELEARDGVSRPGEGEIRNFFTSRCTAKDSILRLDPDDTEDAGVSSRATTFSLPSEEP